MSDMKCDHAYKEVKACSCHYEVKALEAERDKLNTVIDFHLVEIDRLKAELADSEQERLKLQSLHADYPVEFSRLRKEVELWRERAERLAKVLKSIAKNSCCKPCREAGLWAKEALAEFEGKA